MTVNNTAYENISASIWPVGLQLPSSAAVSFPKAPKRRANDTLGGEKARKCRRSNGSNTNSMQTQGEVRD